MSASQRDDKSSDICHDRQRIVSEREMLNQWTWYLKLHHMVSEAVYRLAGDSRAQVYRQWVSSSLMINDSGQLTTWRINTHQNLKAVIPLDWELFDIITCRKVNLTIHFWSLRNDVNGQNSAKKNKSLLSAYSFKLMGKNCTVSFRQVLPPRLLSPCSTLNSDLSGQTSVSSTKGTETPLTRFHQSSTSVIGSYSIGERSKWSFDAANESKLPFHLHTALSSILFWSSADQAAIKQITVMRYGVMQLD